MGTDGVGRDWLGAIEGEGVLGLGLGTPLSPRRWRWVSCVVVASLTRVLVHSSSRVLVHSSSRVLVMFSFPIVVGSSLCSFSPRQLEWASCVVIVVRSLFCVSFFHVVVELSLCRVVVVRSYSCHVVVVSSSHGLFVVLWCRPRSQQGGLRGRWDGWYLPCPRIKGGCTSLLSFEWW